LADSFHGGIDRKEILLEELLKLGPYEDRKIASNGLLVKETFRLFRSSTTLEE